MHVQDLRDGLSLFDSLFTSASPTSWTLLSVPGCADILLMVCLGVNCR